ncbi:MULTISPECIES: universal stress protein [unclassified Haladaptatus]|uniref:universal stress protein n=1 Tax=unclassified Haladaptatus TaxID=2622732 RepID=UPI0023E7EBBC|nr:MULTISPECIES: universal stress protein [unclassified Haladaptatus]
MYDVILVPTDGSDAARAAGTYAISLATEVGAALHVVYVVDEGAANLLLSSHSMSDLLKGLNEAGEQAVGDLEAAATKAGVSVTTEVVQGIHVNEAIIAAAKRADADLIVMATYGERGLEHILGSTTQRVLARSHIPVLAIPSDEMPT